MLADMLEGREKLSAELQHIIDARTEPWGINVISVEVKDVQIPAALQDAMSMQAQAERERQARVILGDSERQVAEKFGEAAKTYADNPTAFHLRAMNMLYEGLKRSNATIVIVPSTAVEFDAARRHAGDGDGGERDRPCAGGGEGARSEGGGSERRAKKSPSRRRSRQLKRVLDETPVLHDDEEIGLRVGNQLEIRERIAVDENEVGERALLDHAELAGIGVARTGHCEQFAVDGGRHSEDLRRAVPLR